MSDEERDMQDCKISLMKAALVLGVVWGGLVVWILLLILAKKP